MKQLMAVLILLLIMFSMTSAEQNCYWKANPDLQRVYEHFEGISLEEAIDILLTDKYGTPRQRGNVALRFNGGGTDNHLFIGKDNTLEFLVSNDATLGGMSLGFEFTCTGGSVFNWVEGYGGYPVTGSPGKVLKIHNSAFLGGKPWLAQVSVDKYPDSILIGGIAFPTDYGYLPSHSTETLLYSMQIRLPDDTSLVGDTFYIDNIFYPPAGDWVLADSASIQGIIPNYQGIYNNSGKDPSAPPAAFEIKDPDRKFAGKSSDSDMANVDDDKVVTFDSPLDFDDFPGIHVDRSGDRIISVIILISNSKEGLDALGIDYKGYTGDWITATFPLDLFPKICQVKGVKRINPVQRAEPESD